MEPDNPQEHNNNSKHSTVQSNVLQNTAPNSLPTPQPATGACKYYVHRKNRYCKFEVSPGQEFCGVHGGVTTNKVPCPYERETYVTNLQKHLEVCPKLKQAKLKENSSWFQKSVNKIGGTSNSNQLKSQEGQNNMQQHLNVEAIRKLYESKDNEFLLLLKKIPQMYFSVFQNDPRGPYYYIDILTAEQLQEDEALVQTYSKSVQGAEIYNQMEQGNHKKQSSQNNSRVQQLNGVENKVNKPQNKSTDLNDDAFQARVLTSMLRFYKLLDIHSIYIQFGAGKGLLSYAIARTFPEGQNSKHVLLEREARRNKFDKYYRHSPYFQRFRGDIEDFNMSDLRNIMISEAKKRDPTKTDQFYRSELFDKNVGLVGVCKHMCGRATDLSLQALSNGSKQIPVHGAVLATCCHHLCTFDYLQNRDFFTTGLGLSAKQTELIFRISSWGTKTFPLPYFCGDKMKILEDVKSDTDNLKEELKYLLGKMCKRLVDRARSKTLNELNPQKQVRFVRYCSQELTPENFALILC